MNYKDPLVKIQIFVSYLENVWYDAAGFIIPQSVVLDLMQDEEEQEEEEEDEEEEEEEEEEQQQQASCEHGGKKGGRNRAWKL